MKTTFRYLGLNAQAAWNRLVDEHLNRLQTLTTMTAARVVLERHRETAPTFRVRMHLEIPGPDLHAEAADFTLRAALLKVAKALERQIHSRQSKRVERRKSRLQVSTLSSRCSGAFAGQRA